MDNQSLDQLKALYNETPFEIFQSHYVLNEETGELNLDVSAHEPCGWFYWFCFPGCLPDSEPIGPFESEEEAAQDLLDIYGE